jgi:prevent-host-death family protein
MEKATISELKNRLSAYLKKVRAGQTILILDRDQPVARLERVAAGGETHDRLARLERAGLLRRATRPVSAKALRAAPVPAAQGGVVAALIAERSETR